MVVMKLESVPAWWVLYASFRAGLRHSSFASQKLALSDSHMHFLSFRVPPWQRAQAWVGVAKVVPAKSSVSAQARQVQVVGGFRLHAVQPVCQSLSLSSVPAFNLESGTRFHQRFQIPDQIQLWRYDGMYTMVEYTTWLSFSAVGRGDTDQDTSPL